MSFLLFRLRPEHAHNKTVDKSQDTEPETAKEALDCIGAIYKVEDEIRKVELQDEEKREYRQQNAKPLVDQFFNWHEEQLQRLKLEATH